MVIEISTYLEFIEYIEGSWAKAISEGFWSEIPCLTTPNEALNGHVQEEHLDFKATWIWHRSLPSTKENETFSFRALFRDE